MSLAYKNIIILRIIKLPIIRIVKNRRIESIPLVVLESRVSKTPRDSIRVFRSALRHTCALTFVTPRWLGRALIAKHPVLQRGS